MLAAAIALLGQTPPSAALQPSGPWTVAALPTGCLVTRPYGVAGDVTVGLERQMMGAIPTIVAFGQHDLFPKGAGKTSIRADRTSKIEVKYQTNAAASGGRAMMRLYSTADGISKLLNADTWTLGQVEALVPDKPTARRMLDACATRILVSWGIDPKLMFEDRVARFPPDVARYFGSRSYPKAAARARVEGAVTILLSTTADGSVSECKILDSASESLNNGTCDAAKQMKVIPPLDANNQPISSYLVVPVTWVLPR